VSAQYQSGPPAGQYPPPGYAYPPPPAPPPRRGIGCGWLILGGCFVLLAGCIVLGGAGYFAVSSGAVTLETVLRWVGMGPATVEVDNFRDDAIVVTILQLDTASEDFPFQASLNLNAFDVHSREIGTAGRYQVDFGTEVAPASLGSCVLRLDSGDHYQFVTLPDKIVVNRVDDPVSSGTDLIVSTSALCRQ
jgi:hypothetical protein